MGHDSQKHPGAIRCCIHSTMSSRSICGMVGSHDGRYPYTIQKNNSLLRCTRTIVFTIAPNGTADHIPLVTSASVNIVHAHKAESILDKRSDCDVPSFHTAVSTLHDSVKIKDIVYGKP